MASVRYLRNSLTVNGRTEAEISCRHWGQALIAPTCDVQTISTAPQDGQVMAGTRVDFISSLQQAIHDPLKAKSY